MKLVFSEKSSEKCCCFASLSIFIPLRSYASSYPDNADYYVKWVSDCYRYFDVPATYSLTNEQNIEFINHLAKKHEDRQVQQAEKLMVFMDFLIAAK